MTPGEVPATAPDLKVDKADVISVEPCFAQDLLVQEGWKAVHKQGLCPDTNTVTYFKKFGMI